MSTSTAFESDVINTLCTGNAVSDLIVCMTVPAVVKRIADSDQDELRVTESVVRFVHNLLFPRNYVTHVVETKEITGNYSTYRVGEGSKGSELVTIYAVIWEHLQRNLFNIVIPTSCCWFYWDWQVDHLDTTPQLLQLELQTLALQLVTELLQKAILLYLTEHLELTDKPGRYELMERPNAKRFLEEKEFLHIDLEKRKRIKALLDEAASPEVAKLGVSVLPPRNRWVTVEEGVEFMNETKKENDDKSTTIQETKTLFHLRSNFADGPERIDAFVKKAFEFYRDIENKKFTNDTSRYMYVRSSDRPPASDSDDESKTNAPYHKRYALGDDKTFDNVFFYEKESLLQLLDHFENKTGKFAIEGFPNKVGLLLYGPPGTGKTSVIKAVAEKTGCHVVNVSLGKIKTNQELMDAMFDLRYAVDGLDLPVRMNFKDIVFVMEDIDCASSVVASREDGSTTPVSETAEENKEAASKEAGEEKEAATTEDAPKMESPLPFFRRRKDAARFFSSGLDDDDDDDDDFFAALLQSQGEFEGFGPIGPKMKGGFVSSSNSTDKLNLAGVLNVLDGVIDCPGRIVIMTTNHPEMLDPALVRPGRISKKIHLGYMSTVQMEKMIAYYFSSTFTSEQRRRLESIEASKHEFTPAGIEELCAEYNSIDEVLEQLVQKVAPNTQ